MHCVYRAGDRPCPNDPTDARMYLLNDRDWLELVFCVPHAQAYDAIMWAARRKQ